MQNSKEPRKEDHEFLKPPKPKRQRTKRGKRGRGTINANMRSQGESMAASSSNAVLTPVSMPAPQQPQTPNEAAQQEYEYEGHPSTTIRRARPYVTETQLLALLDGGETQKDTLARLQACAWLVQVGDHLQFPARVICTAMTLYHRFKVFNPHTEFQYQDLAAASLFVSSKIEDTLKKSREILAAAYNLRSSPAEPIAQDSPILEEQWRRTIGIERLILESINFDFRGNRCFGLVIKFCRLLELSKDCGRVAWLTCIDMHRTFAPIKRTSHIIALAAVEVGARLSKERYTENPYHPDGFHEIQFYWPEVKEVIDDVMTLYMDYRSFTAIGERYTQDGIMQVAIAFNRDGGALRKLRPSKSTTSLNGSAPPTPQREAQTQPDAPYVAPPESVIDPSERDVSLADRGTHGTIRFILDAERAKREIDVLNRFQGQGGGGSGGGETTNGSSSRT